MPTIPDFTRRAWQEGRRDPQLIISILDGKGVEMPPFRDKLTRAQVGELVAFIRGFEPSQAKRVRTAPTDFETQFKQLEEEFGKHRNKAGPRERTPQEPRPDR